jgi:hypothetical protein
LDFNWAYGRTGRGAPNAESSFSFIVTVVFGFP